LCRDTPHIAPHIRKTFLIHHEKLNTIRYNEAGVGFWYLVGRREQVLLAGAGWLAALL